MLMKSSRNNTILCLTHFLFFSVSFCLLSIFACTFFFFFWHFISLISLFHFFSGQSLPVFFSQHNDNNKLCETSYSSFGFKISPFLSIFPSKCTSFFFF